MTPASLANQIRRASAPIVPGVARLKNKLMKVIAKGSAGGQWSTQNAKQDLPSDRSDGDLYHYTGKR